MTALAMKSNNVCDLLFAYTDSLVLPNWGLLLTQLHSERPKLYTIFAFLSAIGLKKEFVPMGANSVF